MPVVPPLRNTPPAADRAADIRAFRDALLRETVEWCCERSPFYAARFATARAGFRGLDDLPRLPVLHRREVVENQRALLCEQVQPACVQYTSGTTGEFLQMFRSPSEVEFISGFLSGLVYHRHQTDAVRPLWLNLTSAYHGSPTPLPGWPYVVSAGVYDRTQADQALRVLRCEYEMPGVQPRVSAVVGSELLLRVLTAFLIDRGIDPAALPVRHLILTGGYLSPSRKSLLGRLWGASVHDRYSMSEVYGGATETGVGGPWLFDVEVVPEVVHPRTLEPVESGVGVLLLTGLYPFMQMMPMVRYYTGDLVEVAPPPRGGAVDLLVYLRGRERRSVIDADGPEVVPLLLSGPLHEMIEALPDVAVSRRFTDLSTGPAIELAGELHYAVDRASRERGSERITVTLGLRYAPWLYPERAETITSGFRESVFDRFAALRKRVGDGRVEFEIELTTADQVRPYNAK